MSYAGKGAAQSSKEVIQTPAVTMFHDRGRQEFHPKYNAVTLEEMSQTQTLKDTISALEFALKLAKTKGLGSTEVARKYYEQLQRQSGVDTVIATVEAAEILTAKDMSRDDLILETAQLYFELVEKQNVSDLKILAQNFYQTNKTVLIKSLGQELYTKQSERLR